MDRSDSLKYYYPIGSSPGMVSPIKIAKNRHGYFQGGSKKKARGAFFIGASTDAMP